MSQSEVAKAIDANSRKFAALVRDDEGGISVRRFATREEASAASAAREHTEPELSPEQVKFAWAVGAYIGRLFGARQIETDQIYTLEEAITYTKCGNLRTFRRWCADYRVSSISRGRYSKRALDGGIKDECRARPAKQPERAA